MSRTSSSTGTSQTSARKCKTKVRTAALIRKVHAVVSKNPRRGIKSLSKQFKTSPDTMRLLLRSDLGLNSYTIKNPAYLAHIAAHPPKLMVWAGFSGQGKLRLRFVPQGQSLNSAFYRDQIMAPAIRSARRKHYPRGEPFLWQQDGARPHTANICIHWLRMHRVHHINPD